MESDDWATHRDYLVDHGSWTHEVQSGLVFRLQYRTTKVGGLTNLVTVVNESAAVNVAQPTGREDGSPIVTTYNWQDYFSTFFTKLKGIKKLHHLRFSSSSPRIVYVKEKAGSPEVKIAMLKVKDWSPKADELPSILPPSGLSLKRQWYLYNKIVEFCPDNLKDITCPLPSEPDISPSHPPSRTPSPSPAFLTSTTNPPTDEPPAK